MSDPNRKTLRKQHSLPFVEKSLKMISPPHQAPITIYPGSESCSGNLSKEDLEIAHRLHKLKYGELELQTEEEMASRLAVLKGLPPDYYSKPKMAYCPPDIRTQTEQSDDLLKQIMDEVSLENKDRASEEVPMGFHMPMAHGQVPGSIAFPMPPLEPASIEGMHLNDVDDLVKQSEKELTEANVALKKDSKSSRLRKHKKEKKPKKDKDDPNKEKKRKKLFKKDKKVKAFGAEGIEGYSSSEFNSGSDSEIHHGKVSAAAVKKEKEEVDRIVAMYGTKSTVKSDDEESNSSFTDSESDSSSGSYYSSDSDFESKPQPK